MRITIIILTSILWLTLCSGQDNTGQANAVNLMVTTGESSSVIELYESSGVHTIDATKSTYQGNETGAVSGVHVYSISGTRNYLDVASSSIPMPLVQGLNSVLTGGAYQKSIAGNSWNSDVNGSVPLSTSQDFAVTWEVESTTGTIRELAGLTADTSQNSSYTSLRYGIYQVNGTFYRSVYESGSAVSNGVGDVAISVGDRLGIRVESGVVTYFVQKSSGITDIYTSQKLASGVYYFKFAGNRGNASSGHSILNNTVAYHLGTMPGSWREDFEGSAGSVVDVEISDRLMSKGGIIIQPGTTYDLLKFTRPSNPVIEYGGVQYPVDYIHSYRVGNNQSSGAITF